MNQIYNLLETIENDKKMILELEESYQKKLHTLKGVLAAHEDALERLTSIPKVNSEKVENLIEKSSSENRQRITMDNWKDLHIEVGDTVEIVVSGDINFSEGNYKVESVEDEGYYDNGFISLEQRCYEYLWYWYNNNDLGKDELYLIKG